MIFDGSHIKLTVNIIRILSPIISSLSQKVQQDRTFVLVRCSKKASADSHIFLHESGRGNDFIF